MPLYCPKSGTPVTTAIPVKYFICLTSCTTIGICVASYCYCADWSVTPQLTNYGNIMTIVLVIDTLFFTTKLNYILLPVYLKHRPREQDSSFSIRYFHPYYTPYKEMRSVSHGELIFGRVFQAPRNPLSRAAPGPTVTTPPLSIPRLCNFHYHKQQPLNRIDVLIFFRHEALVATKQRLCE